MSRFTVPGSILEQIRKYQVIDVEEIQDDTGCVPVEVPCMVQYGTDSTGSLPLVYRATDVSD